MIEAYTTGRLFVIAKLSATPRSSVSYSTLLSRIQRIRWLAVCVFWLDESPRSQTHLKTQPQGAHGKQSKANVCGTKPFLINSDLLFSEAPGSCLAVLSQTQYEGNNLLSLHLFAVPIAIIRYIVPSLKSTWVTSKKLKVETVLLPPQLTKLFMLKSKTLKSLTTV